MIDGDTPFALGRSVGLPVIRFVDNDRGPHRAISVGVLALEAAFGYGRTGETDCGTPPCPTQPVHYNIYFINRYLGLCARLCTFITNNFAIPGVWMSIDEQIVSPRKDLTIPYHSPGPSVRSPSHFTPERSVRYETSIVNSWTGEGRPGGYATDTQDAAPVLNTKDITRRVTNVPKTSECSIYRGELHADSQTSLMKPKSLAKNLR